MVQDPTPYEAMMQAIDCLGSQSELARLCCLTPTAVWKWVQSTKRLPAEYVLRVEAKTGISRHHLRPDIYPVEASPPRFFGVDRAANRVAFNRGPVSKEAAA